MGTTSKHSSICWIEYAQLPSHVTWNWIARVWCATPNQACRAPLTTRSCNSRCLWNSTSRTWSEPSMFRFLHAADIHLDSPLRGLDEYEGAPVQALRGATRRAFAA